MSLLPARNASRPGDDPIFALNREAMQRRAAGERIVNATVGALLEDDGLMSLLRASGLETGFPPLWASQDSPLERSATVDAPPPAPPAPPAPPGPPGPPAETAEAAQAEDPKNEDPKAEGDMPARPRLRRSTRTYPVE
jgi:hypothetical protein